MIRSPITNPNTGGSRTPYARIPMRLTPQQIAKSYAEGAMRERGGAEPGIYGEAEAAVYGEIRADRAAGV